MLATACTTASNTQLRQLQDAKAFEIKRADSDRYDYVVKFNDYIADGYSPQNPETRKLVAMEAMKSVCDKPSIVGQDILKIGQHQGKDQFTYFVHMKCG